MARTTKQLYGTTSNVNDYEQEESESNTETRLAIKPKIWKENEINSLETLMKYQSRNITIDELIKENKGVEENAICLYRFASNCSGEPCKNPVISGICLLHWNNLGVGFINMHGNTIKNSETGATTYIDGKITPIFLTTHPTKNIIVSPIIGSIRPSMIKKGEADFVNTVETCYTLAKDDEAKAMAVGLYHMLYDDNTDVSTIRKIWIDKQIQQCRVLDTQSRYQLLLQDTIQKTTDVATITVNDMNIFDTPFLLAIPPSSVLVNEGKTALCNVSNFTMFQSKQYNGIGTFSIVGCIPQAPFNSHKSQQNIKKTFDNIPKQHTVIPVKLTGIATDFRETIILSELAKSEIYVINVSTTEPFSNNRIDKIRNSSLLNYFSKSIGNENNRRERSVSENTAEEGMDNDNENTSFLYGTGLESVA